MIEQAIEKSAILIEALPYIQRFRGETVVVKFGGSIINDEQAYENILRDVAFMECVGLRPVVIHGGGKAITARLAEKNIKTEFLDGHRITDQATVEVVNQVLNHEVNPHLVELVESMNCKAKGIHGNTILEVEKKLETDVESGEEKDWGFVGEVVSVNVDSIIAALDEEIIPIVTPLGQDKEGQLYNINADVAAGAIARELKARKLVFLSDVPGIMMDPANPESIISSLNKKQVEQLIEDGVIAGGMLPKVGGALKALDAGIRKTHFIDGGMPHSLLLEIFTDKGVGTEIIADE